MGFDNLEIAELTSPELTTLEVPARDMGRIAADYHSRVADAAQASEAARACHRPDCQREHCACSSRLVQAAAITWFRPRHWRIRQQPGDGRTVK